MLQKERVKARITIASISDAFVLLDHTHLGTGKERQNLVRLVIDSDETGVIAGFLTKMHSYEEPHLRRLRKCSVNVNQYRRGLLMILKSGKVETLLTILPWVVRDRKYAEESEAILHRLAVDASLWVAFRVLDEVPMRYRFRRWRMLFLQKILGKSSRNWLHRHYPDVCNLHLSVKEADQLIVAVTRSSKTYDAMTLLSLVADDRRSVSIHRLDRILSSKLRPELRQELLNQQQRIRLFEHIARGSHAEDAKKLFDEQKKLLGIELDIEQRTRLVKAIVRGLTTKKPQMYDWQLRDYVERLLRDPKYRSLLEPFMETPELKSLKALAERFKRQEDEFRQKLAEEAKQ